MTGTHDRMTPQAPPDAAAAVGFHSGSRVDAGTKTQSGPLGRIDPPQPAPPGTVPRPPLAAASTMVIGGFVALIASLLLLAYLADGVRGQEAFALDAWATPFLHSIATPGLTAFMTGLTTMGSALVLVPLFVAVAAGLLVKKRYGAALFFGVSMGGALIIDATMKVIFERPRPKLDYAAVQPDYSFPSGHSMNGIVFYVGLALIAWSIFGRRIGLRAVVLASILAFGIGLSRIYLGYHYFTDVVGGFLAGIAWLLIVGAAFRARPKVWPWLAEGVPIAAAALPAAPEPSPETGPHERRGGQAST